MSDYKLFAKGEINGWMVEHLGPLAKPGQKPKLFRVTSVEASVPICTEVDPNTLPLAEDEDE